MSVCFYALICLLFQYSSEAIEDNKTSIAFISNCQNLPLFDYFGLSSCLDRRLYLKAFQSTRIHSINTYYCTTISTTIHLAD